MRKFLFVLVASLLPTLAFADDDAKGECPCKADAAKLCPGIEHGPALHACMAGKSDQLSDACKAKMAAKATGCDCAKDGKDCGCHGDKKAEGCGCMADKLEKKLDEKAAKLEKKLEDKVEKKLEEKIEAKKPDLPNKPVKKLGL